MENRRRHKRFSATAFLNRPILLLPLPPYFGHAVKGKLIDLSAGGMAILIDEMIPMGTNLSLMATFPDGFKIECAVQVKHQIPREEKYIHGFEFLNLAPVTMEKIEKMSSDYIDCESRIAAHAQEICRTHCAFFTMCNKPEKLDLTFEPSKVLELQFKPIHPTHL
jgi:hypothetical protein